MGIPKMHEKFCAETSLEAVTCSAEDWEVTVRKMFLDGLRMGDGWNMLKIVSNDEFRYYRC
jgi:hypothetical protein